MNPARRGHGDVVAIALGLLCFFALHALWYYVGWLDGGRALRNEAAAAGAGEYLANPKTGAPLWRWKVITATEARP